VRGVVAVEVDILDGDCMRWLDDGWVMAWNRYKVRCLEGGRTFAGTRLIRGLGRFWYVLVMSKQCFPL
jgi:hypothetical protein